MSLLCPKCGYENQDDALSCNLCQEVLRKESRASSPGKTPEEINHAGTLLLGRDQFEPAIALFRQALELKPQDVTFRCNLASALARSGSEEEALREYEQCLRLDPNDFHSHFNLGNMRWRRREFDAAAACFERAQSLEPERPEAHYHLGLCLRQMKLWDKAIPVLEKALALAPRHPIAAEAHVLSGIQYTSERAWEKAETHLLAALELSPDYFMAHFSLADLYLLMGAQSPELLQKAGIHARRACALEPQDADAAALLKDIQSAQGGAT